jgi:VanZ family protein
MRNKPPAMWWYWAPPLLWIALIFYMSSDVFSSAHTGVWLLRAMRFLHVPLKYFSVLHIGLRKGGHFAGYCVLSLLFFRAWRASLPIRHRVRGLMRPLWTLRWASLAVAASAVAAALDEFHQSFVPSRTASIYDVGLDTMGAIFAQVIIMMLLLDRGQEDSS